MTDTTKGTRKRIEELNKKLDEMESATKESGGLLFWRGKKIISVEQWQSIAKRGRYEEAIKYIPNGFISYPLLGLASQNETGRGYNDERCNKWIDDYYDYLDYSRNPKLGETKCGRCLLVDDKDQIVSTGLDLRKIVRKSIQLSLKSAGKSSSPLSSETEQSNSSDSISSSSIHNDHHKDLQETPAVIEEEDNEQREEEKNSMVTERQQPITIDYPCPVHDRFQCPYRNYSVIDDTLLVDIGEGIKEIYDALSYAHTQTYQVRDNTYKVNFEKDIFLGSFNAHGGSSGGSNCRLEVELGRLKEPKVPIESIHDIYTALTNRENLDILLEQYLEHRRNNPRDYGDNPNFDYAQRKEQDDILRRMILDWFMQLKDHIRIEDLTNFYGITLQEEENRKRSLDQNWPRRFDHFNDICCECNNRWACILCVNCDKWICADHWRNHKAVHHLRQ
jgi:hypothetical protein